MAVAKTKASLLDIAKAAATIQRKHKCWLDDLDQDSAAQVIEGVRHLYETGGNRSAVVAAWQKAGVPITTNKMDQLIDKVRRGIL
jgi:hypothetical protein